RSPMLKRLAAVAAVGLAGVILTLATPAHATTDDPAFQHGQPDFTAQPTGECGEIELTFTNPTPWLFVFDYRVDGQDPLHGSVAPGVEIDEGPLAGQEFGPRWNLVELNGQGTQTVVVPFTTSVEVRLAEGAEQKLYFDWRQVDTSTVKPCPTEPTEPTEPSEPSDGQGGSDDGDKIGRAHV